MGQCCSDVTGQQDPDDMSLDFFNLSTTGLGDEFYEEATGLLDEAVDIHNSICDAIENLKMSGAAMLGSYRPVTVVKDGKVNLITLTPEGKEAQMLNNNATRFRLAKTLFMECHKTITTLNREGLGTGLSVRGGFKLVGQNCAVHTVALYNRQIYMYAKELMLQSGGISLEVYINELKTALGKLGKKVMFAVSTFDDGSLRIEASRFAASHVPDGARAMLDALKTIEDEFKARAEEIPHLSMRLQHMVDQAAVLVQKIENALQNKNVPKNSGEEPLTEDSLLHAKANYSKITAGHQVIENLVLTMKDCSSRLKQYLEDPR